MNPTPLVLGLDLEGINQDLSGKGVDVSTDRVIEIGAVLMDWNSFQPVKILSELIDEVDRLEISAEVEELTGSKSVTLENEIDESIIGGFILRVGDVQYTQVLQINL